MEQLKSFDLSSQNVPYQALCCAMRWGNKIGRLTIMLMACLFLSGAAHAAWDISITRTPANDPIVVCLGTDVSVVLSANITGTAPTETAECTVSGPTWKWTGDATGTSSSTTVTKSYTTTGDKTISATVEAKYTYTKKADKPGPCPDPETKSKSITINVKVVRAKIKTPNGDPTQNPGANGANDTNERDFNSASPGVATVPCEAEATPDADKLRWKITDVGGTKAKWNPHVTGDEYTGKGLSPTATYTGLPEKYNDFGLKTITLTMEGVSCNDSTKVEIFFNKTAKNHPSDASNADWPNWMFYWWQTVTPLGTPAPTAKYGPSSKFVAGTTEIVLSDGDAGSYNAPHGANNPVQGIDNFAWTVIHESQHYVDWVNLWDNDPVKWNNSKGKNGPNDEKDGDRIPNKVEDVDLDGTYNAGDLYDWTKLLTPGHPAGIINDFEDWDCVRNKNAKGDHSKDWASPGMQRKTLDKYDD